MRIAVGSIMQESNSFVPFRTTLATFQSTYLHFGKDMLTGFGAARVEVPGFLSVLNAAGATVLPLLATHALSGGPVTRQAFDALLNDMIDRLEQEAEVDGVLLALHGAMCVEDNPDAEGEIIERVAAAVRKGTPIGVSLDLHGHVTPRMLQPDTFLIGYREYPHIDMFETGQRVARLLLDTLAGRCHPVMALAKRPMIVSPIAAQTTEEPLASIVARARRMEAEEGLLHVSLFPVQPWLDVPDLGFAVLVCADGDPAAAQKAADQLADQAWLARDDFEPQLTALTDAIRIGLSSEGTTVVGDGGDAPSSGAAADNPGILSALLAAGADKAGRLTYLTICDAPAAQSAALAGVGADISLLVGHSLSAQDGRPIAIRCRVRSISDGTFIMYDKGAEGLTLRQGLTSVVAIGDIRLVIRSVPGFEWDTGIYVAFGLELNRAALIFVKSPSHFRAAFAPCAARILAADTPGPTTGNMHRLVFKQATRPLFPLDKIPIPKAISA